jgi:hypothetical protein
VVDSNTLVAGAIQTLVGLLVSTGFLLTLFVGFCVVAGFSKIRKIGKGSLVHRNLVDQMGSQELRYLAPDAPRGQADQLRTPELLEQTGSKE